jgi:N-terminal domain of anti-restriction factor ArdC
MQLYGKAEEVGNKILEAFEYGSIPQAIAPMFIKRKDNVPCRSWSWNNQLIVALMGHGDARGFQQWKEVNRHVKAGEKAFHILIPLTKKVEDKEGSKEKLITYGFKTAAVFGLSQTEGEPLKADVEAQNWIAQLPLIDVAKSWNLAVNSFSGENARYLGYYKHG